MEFRAHGFHVVYTFSHQYDPIGVTIVSIISEFHFAIHSYPETNHASIDIFHCSDESQPLAELLNFLIQVYHFPFEFQILGAQNHKKITIV